MLASRDRVSRRYQAGTTGGGTSITSLTWQVVGPDWFVDTTSAAGDAFMTASGGVYSLDTTAVAGLVTFFLGSRLFIVN